MKKKIVSAKIKTCGAESPFVNHYRHKIESPDKLFRTKLESPRVCFGMVVGLAWGNNMRVLLIEDDSATAQSIELMLKTESFNIYTTDLGEEGVDLGKLYDYDIILLDLNLPDMSGYEVLRTLRVARVKTPILILSGLAGIEDKVRGLGFGADDYLTKPFHKDELIARIQAIVRRSKGHAQSVIETGELLVNLDQKTVEVEGQRVHLTGKEYQMLELLSLRKGTTLTKEMFLNHLYGGMDEPELKIIDVFICKLRKKLAQATKGDHFIETVWGRGYVLRDPDPRAANAEQAA
jgi:two-component system cell cycle response regulator CtrA